MGQRGGRSDWAAWVTLSILPLAGVIIFLLTTHDKIPGWLS